jgi:hypothetical protein
MLWQFIFKILIDYVSNTFSGSAQLDSIEIAPNNELLELTIFVSYGVHAWYCNNLYPITKHWTPQRYAYPHPKP